MKLLQENSEVKVEKIPALIITLVSLCVMFLLRDNFSVNIPLFLFILISGIGMLFFNEDDFKAFGMSLVLFANGLQIFYILAIAILIYLFKFGLKAKVNSILIIFVAFIILEATHIFVAPFDIMEYARDAIYLFFIGLLLSDSSKLPLHRVTKLVSTYLYVYCFTMFDIMLQFLKKHGSITKMFTEGIRFGNLTSDSGDLLVSLYDNENMIALYCIMALSVCIEMLFVDKGKKIKWLIFLGISLFFGLCTLSKTFFLVLICIFVFVLWQIFADKKIPARTKKRVLFSMIFIVGLFAISPASSLVTNVIARFGNGDLTTGRLGIMQDYHSFMMENLKYCILGIGLQSVSSKTGIIKSPHNAIQETFVCSGIVGLLMFVLLFYLLIKRSKTKDFSTKYIVIITFLVFIQSLQFVRSSSIMLLLIFVDVSLKVTLFDHNDNEITIKTTK